MAGAQMSIRSPQVLSKCTVNEKKRMLNFAAPFAVHGVVPCSSKARLSEKGRCCPSGQQRAP